MSKRPLLLNEQMTQWVELHRLSGSAMKDAVIGLWPNEPIPDSYFGLVQRLAAADETIRAELARAKEQARMSNVAAKKAANELKAE